MSDTITLVKGDSFPDIHIALKDSNTGDPSDPDSWDAIDVSDATTSVSVKFRKRGETTVLATMPCTKVDGGSTGKVYMPWSAGVLDNDPGLYEGEISIDFDGAVQTVVEKLKFRIKDEF